jgi:hypothetical protein
MKLAFALFLLVLSSSLLEVSLAGSGKPVINLNIVMFLPHLT